MRSLRPLVRHTGMVLAASLLAIPLAAIGQANVFTWHNDNWRTGQNRKEAILTRAKVNSSNFGALFQVPMDGKVDAQPLYVSGIEMFEPGSHNVVYAATEHDSVYAFDADTGHLFWKTSLLASGETPSDDRGCNQVTPEIGVTATPAISRRAWYDGSIYVVAMSKDASGNYHQRLHALDLRYGTEQFGGPVEIQATYPGTGDNSSNGTVTFDPKQYKDRAAILLVGNNLYTSWGSHCDIAPFTGWVIGYSQTTLQQTSVFNFAPNGTGGSLWNSGAGPAADNGNLYFALANGTFDTTFNPQGFPSGGDFGNSLVKLSLQNGELTPLDYWTMYNANAESATDTDLGSGGAMLLPDQKDATGKTRHLAVAAGKDSNIYVADRDNMGKFDPNSNSTLYQQLNGVLPGGVFSSPAYFAGRVYYGSVNSPLQGFVVNEARLASSPSSTTSNNFGYPGATPSISAYKSSEGIVWAVENGSPAVLHAYDAYNLAKELYNSNQAPSGRDNFGGSSKFPVPTIANGKVFIGTQNSIAVFGIRPQPAPVIPDGLYNVINHSSGLLLNDPVSSTTPGVQIIQFPERGGLNEHWLFSYQGNDYYLIQNASSGLFLTDPNNATTPGPLEQNLPLNNDTQLWSLIPNGTGYVIRNKATGLVIDDSNRNPDPGGIITWFLVSTDPSLEAFYVNQIWTIEQAH